MTLNKFILYYNTLKYLKPVQVYGRIYTNIKRKFNSIIFPAIPDELLPSLTSKTKFINHDPWNKEAELNKGNFTFLNFTRNLGSPVNWHIKDASLLWLFNLHYFNYLYLLNKEDQIKLCKDWITHNDLDKGIARHPYVISIRLVNWCKIGFGDNDINKNIYKQASYLYRNLEFYHPANHYLENARALIFTGLYFNQIGESNKWLQKGLEIYLTETPRQVLKDGGYFEKSMMYHAIILEGYLDILNILPSDNNSYPIFKSTIKNMLNYLRVITHPDGKLSLFNDSTQEIAPMAKELVDYSERLNIRNDIPEDKSSPETKIYPLDDSGYYIYKGENIYLIIDGASIGPDCIPVHAHADIFSYELSFYGRQFIVDSGVYEYQTGEMRNYVRSTKAHNTITVDNKDQAEMWGAFRVARRYSPNDVSFYDNGKEIIFDGEFDGYSMLTGDNIIHKRVIVVEKDISEITIKDEISGNGEHLVESYIHIHPDFQIDEFSDYITFTREDVKIQLDIINSSYSIEEGWYCPEFGNKIPNKVVRLYSDHLPARLSYRFCKVKAATHYCGQEIY